MTTVKIKPSHPSQGEFVVIEKKDFDPAIHELSEGESLGSDTGAAGERMPTLAELQARKDQLDDLELILGQRGSDQAEREQALATREAAVAKREQTNEAEAQRLRDEATSLQATKNAVAAQAQDAAATAAVEKPAKAAKA